MCKYLLFVGGATCGLLIAEAYIMCATKLITISLASVCQPWRRSMLWNWKWQCGLIFMGTAPVGGTPEDDKGRGELGPPGENGETCVGGRASGSRRV